MTECRCSSRVGRIPRANEKQAVFFSHAIRRFCGERIVGGIPLITGSGRGVAMHATLAFLNGAGSRRNLKSGSTDRRLLTLTDLLFTTGFTPEPARADNA